MKRGGDLVRWCIEVVLCGKGGGGGGGGGEGGVCYGESKGKEVWIVMVVVAINVLVSCSRFSIV